MENNDKNTKKNFLIYSLSGMFFKGSSSNDEPETSLTESEISENLFGGSKLGSLSLLPEMMGLSEEDAEKMGFDRKEIILVENIVETVEKYTMTGEKFLEHATKVIE